ncbi:hypothetical protein D3C76_1094000 [compost metagenome]
MSVGHLVLTLRYSMASGARRPAAGWRGDGSTRAEPSDYMVALLKTAVPERGTQKNAPILPVA